MTQFIEAAIDENRVMSFDMKAVYEGENNSSVIKIPLDIWADESIDFYSLSLETYPFGRHYYIGNIGREDCPFATVSEGFLLLPLTTRLTSAGKLRLQLSAHYTDENGREIIEKTSIANLVFKPSMVQTDLTPAEFTSLQSQFNTLKARVDDLSKEMDYDYFCAALCARLMYVNKRVTPLHFPENGSKAEELVDELLSDFTADGKTTHYIIMPTYSGECASLIAIYAVEGNAVVGRYSGRALLEFMLSQVKG